jgi:hypothetical protein
MITSTRKSRSPSKKIPVCPLRRKTNKETKNDAKMDAKKETKERNEKEYGKKK